MKKTFTFLSLLFFTTLSFGQNPIVLGEEYLLEILDLDFTRGVTEKVQVRKMADYALYKRVKQGVKRQEYFSKEDIKKANETIPFIGEKGKYVLNNGSQEFHFNLDENGRLSGRGSLVVTKEENKAYWDFEFDDAKVTSVEIKNEPQGKPIMIMSFGDLDFMLQNFDPQTGKLVEKQTLQYFEDSEDFIESTYNQADILVNQTNSKLATEKTFYDNGKLKISHNLLSGDKLYYDETGDVIQRSYILNSLIYDEFYENGVLTSKKSKNYIGSIETQYYYSNGNLESYEVFDHKIGESRKYDKNDTLLSTQPIGAVAY
ncbi:toxin-antitoxin system YwqK family antitoxin [Myroides sp. LJL116]